MVVGGEVVTLKSIEESSSLAIAEMPIHVSFVYLHNFFFYLNFAKAMYNYSLPYLLWQKRKRNLLPIEYSTCS